ncbi:MAG: hypothetical protein AMS24_01745 [Chlamydiae bacterium SM23_39]|nr:MAG: hypothetical protein AMS24_01745 [Chlamydiae bacterium SM23_39]
MQKPTKDRIPLILRFHRLMDAFTKSNDERDFYLNKVEGFLIYVDLDKPEEELNLLEKELGKEKNKFCLIPKMTFFEIKKFMEGFINEKVYDIDTKEKLLDIISAKDPRENFLEYIYEQLTELEKWQQYYQDRSRIKVIEWLRSHNILFVFEEDLEFSRNILEKLKRTFFEEKVSKDIASARNILLTKAKMYYSNEALNPRPKRGRPPKQISKTTIEPQFTVDIYTTVSSVMRPFLYIPDITNAASITFSSKFETEEQLLASLRGTRIRVDEKLEALSQRLESLKKLSERFGKDITKLDETLKAFKPIGEPIKKKEKKIAAIVEEKEEKVGEAIKEVLPPKKRGKVRKIEKKGEYVGPKKKPFTIRKVAQIKTKKKKK